MTWRPGRTTLLTVALAVSLCLNLFAGGLMIGRLQGLGLDQGRLMERAIGRFLDTMPEEAREPLRAAFSDHRAELAEQVLALRDARRTAFQQIRSEDLDQATLDASFSRIREHTGELQRLLQEVFGQTLLAVPADVRANWQPPGLLRQGGLWQAIEERMAEPPAAD